jgi:CBS domain-containing protein
MTTPRPERPVSSVMSWPVASIDHEATLAEAVDALAADSIGVVLVLREGGLAGILSERDVVTHLAAGADPRHLLVGEAMVPDLVTIQGDEAIVDAARLMLEAEIRHLPVLTENLLAGVVSMRDVVASLAAAVEGDTLVVPSGTRVVVSTG